MLRKIEDGTAKHCFGRTINEQRSDLGFSQTEAMFIGLWRPFLNAYVVSSLLEAGSDTTRGTLSGMFAGALAYPDWPIRARQHLDSVCGDAERLPSFSDVKDLSYIRAVVKECLRWRPFVDAGMNHMCTEDFEFEGYYFPKGTLFTWNAWAISQNPQEYEDPARFWPERYMDEHVENVLHGVWGFGAGRRICAGYPLAARSLFITISRLLYCFDFEYAGVRLRQLILSN
jgi:cytochrome P450